MSVLPFPFLCFPPLLLFSVSFRTTLLYSLSIRLNSPLLRRSYPTLVFSNVSPPDFFHLFHRHRLQPPPRSSSAPRTPLLQCDVALNYLHIVRPDNQPFAHFSKQSNDSHSYGTAYDTVAEEEYSESIISGGQVAVEETRTPHARNKDASGGFGVGGQRLANTAGSNSNENSESLRFDDDATQATEATEAMEATEATAAPESLRQMSFDSEQDQDSMSMSMAWSPNMETPRRADLVRYVCS